MAISQTTRLGVYTWSSGSDEFTRDQMTDSHQSLEDRVALFLAGTFASRPAASSGNARGFYLATDQNILYYSDGSNWFSVNSFSNPVGIVPGDSNTAGSSTFAARADHKHSLPEWGVVGEITQVGTAAAAGSTAKFARVDHRHTLGAGSVTVGTIASGAVNNSNLFSAGVVNTTAIADSSITKSKLSADQQTPSGAIMAFAGTSAPVGWLFCDGTSYPVNTYPDLAAALNGRYGGSATPGSNFNVPDLRNRFPRGANTTSGPVTFGGSSSVTLDVNTLPAHDHTFSATTGGGGQHSHSYSGNTGGHSNGHSHNMWHGHGANLRSRSVTGGTGPFNVFHRPVDGDKSESWAQARPNIWDSTGYYHWITTIQVADATVDVGGPTTANTGDVSANHSHGCSGNTSNPGDHTHTVSGTTASRGTGNPIDILPPFQSVNYIIKI